MASYDSNGKFKDMMIRPLKPADLPMLVRHKVRHSEENGRDGDVIFAPIEGVDPITEDDLRRSAAALSIPVTDRGWMRVWILTDEVEVYGELTLIHRPPLKTSIHRCHLMMGLERNVRRQGFGSKLMLESMTWAHEQPTLDWIALNVFENNQAAKSLYSKFGFKPVGTTRDLFRVFGQSIDDTEMVIKLR